MKLSAPAPLEASHLLGDFRCPEPALEDWLKRRAWKNQRDGASRCFVVCEKDAVVGYYALAAGAVAHSGSPGAIRRNMPEPIPVIVLGRLAVHADHVGRGIGAGLLKDAVLRAVRASQALGIRAMLCHAISEDAKRFYLRHGFAESPVDPLTLFLNLTRLTADD